MGNQSVSILPNQDLTPEQQANARENMRAADRNSVFALAGIAAGIQNTDVPGVDTLAFTPTVTSVANFATSGIASPKTYPALSAVGGSVRADPFRYIGSRVGLAGLSNPTNALVHQVSNSNTSINDQGCLIIEFGMYGKNLEIPWYGTNGSIRVFSDNKEMFIAAPGLAGTAQAGSGTTIQLAASGPSSTNGNYNTQWAYITGGTGAGSYAQITGYVGSTKTAAIDPATGSWTAPDATSTYEIRQMRSPLLMPGGTFTLYNILLTFSEAKNRRIRIEMRNGKFWGVRTDATGTVYPVKPSTMGRIFIGGDSFGEGVGAWLRSTGLAAQAGGRMGYEVYECAAGGTGYLGTGVTGLSMKVRDRIAPPSNSWQVFIGGATGGTYTLSYGGYTTTAIARAAPPADIETALVALPSIGAGNVKVFDGVKYDGGAAVPVMFRNALAEAAGVLTVDGSSLTGALRTPTCTRHIGDIASNLPLDSEGNVLPFVIALIAGRNDSAASMANIQAEVETLLDILVERFPTAVILMSGVLYLPFVASGAVVDANSAIRAAATAKLPHINGVLPFVDTLTDGWITGLGNIGVPTGSGNSDVFFGVDAIHPTQAGHDYYGRRLSEEWLYFLRGYV